MEGTEDEADKPDRRYDYFAGEWNRQVETNQEELALEHCKEMAEQLKGDFQMVAEGLAMDVTHIHIEVKPYHPTTMTVISRFTLKESTGTLLEVFAPKTMDHIPSPIILN